MEPRRVGSLAVSVVGVGCNNFGGRIDENRSKEAIDAALDVGINFFDTAAMYANGKSEELLGRFLGPRRRGVIVATKFGNEMEGQGRGARPGSARFVSVQNEYSLLHREPEDEVLRECERQGLAFLPFFPLMSGLLTGKYRKGKPIPQDTRVARYERYNKLLTEENLNKVEALINFAESRGRTLLELAFSWLLAHRVVASVIAGATSAEQVRNNAAAADWNLTPADLEEIDSLLRAAV